MYIKKNANHHFANFIKVIMEQENKAWTENFLNTAWILIYKL